MDLASSQARWSSVERSNLHHYRDCDEGGFLPESLPLLETVNTITVLRAGSVDQTHIDTKIDDLQLPIFLPPQLLKNTSSLGIYIYI